MRRRFFARLGLPLTRVIIWHAERTRRGAYRKRAMYHVIAEKAEKDLAEALMYQAAFKEALK